MTNYIAKVGSSQELGISKNVNDPEEMKSDTTLLNNSISAQQQSNHLSANRLRKVSTQSIEEWKRWSGNVDLPESRPLSNSIVRKGPAIIIPFKPATWRVATLRQTTEESQGSAMDQPVTTLSNIDAPIDMISSYWSQLSFEDFIRCHPLLKYLTVNQIHSLENTMLLETFHPGQVLAEEGEFIGFGIVK
jgi:hypothetical protein